MLYLLKFLSLFIILLLPSSFVIILLLVSLSLFFCRENFLLFSFILTFFHTLSIKFLNTLDIKILRNCYKYLVLFAMIICTFNSKKHLIARLLEG